MSKVNINSDEFIILRNTYLRLEEDYLLFLLSDKKLRVEFEELLEFDNEFLAKRAFNLYNAIEYGNLETKEEIDEMRLMSPTERDQYHLMKLKHAESFLCLLLAAITDKQKLKKLVYSFDDNKANKRVK